MELFLIGENMAVNNEKFWRILRIAVMIGVILASVALAYGALNQKVNYNSIQIEKHEKRSILTKRLWSESKPILPTSKKASGTLRKNSKMPEIDREQLQEVNRELMIANAEYNELLEKLAKIGKRIFEYKKRIDEKLNEKE